MGILRQRPPRGNTDTWTQEALFDFPEPAVTLFASRYGVTTVVHFCDDLADAHRRFAALSAAGKADRGEIYVGGKFTTPVAVLRGA